MDYKIRMKALRKEKKLTQEEIACRLFVCQRTYSDYETGKTRITIETFVELAKIFDVNLDYLTGLSEERHCFPGKNLSSVKSR